jgi:hypothetical protein
MTYVLDFKGLKSFDVPGTTAPPTPSAVGSRTVELAAGRYEVHGTGPFIVGALDAAADGACADLKRALYSDYDLPRVLAWNGDIMALSNLGGSAIVVTITPVLPLEGNVLPLEGNG